MICQNTWLCFATFTIARHRWYGGSEVCFAVSSCRACQLRTLLNVTELPFKPNKWMFFQIKMFWIHKLLYHWGQFYQTIFCPPATATCVQLLIKKFLEFIRHWAPEEFYSLTCKTFLCFFMGAQEMFASIRDKLIIRLKTHVWHVSKFMYFVLIIKVAVVIGQTKSKWPVICRCPLVWKKIHGFCFLPGRFDYLLGPGNIFQY